MDNDEYHSCQEQLENKLKATMKKIDFENKAQKDRENEIIETYKYFSNKICEIMTKSNDIYQAYEESDFFNRIKASDEIRKYMKKEISDLEQDELLSILEKINEYKFDEDTEKVIQSELEHNLTLFLSEYKISKKARILTIIERIKKNFEENFDFLKFNIDDYEKKITEKMEDFKFEDEQIKNIIEKVRLIMKKKLKDLIELELNYY